MFHVYLKRLGSKFTRNTGIKIFHRNLRNQNLRRKYNGDNHHD